MSEVEYRDRSISELINQLNGLGQTDVMLMPTQLIAIQGSHNSQVRRFKTNMGSQFFLTDRSAKKYVYSQVCGELEDITLNNILNNYIQGFNVTILMQNSHHHLKNLLNSLRSWIKKPALSCIDFVEKQFIDVITGEPISPKIIEKRQEKIYSLQFGQLLKYKLFLQEENLRVIRLRDQQQNDCIGQCFSSQMQLILLPRSFLMQKQSNINYTVTKSQIVQVFNYIRANPSKRYQQLHKLIPKRHPLMNYLTSMLLQDSANFILNWVDQGPKGEIEGRLDFYDKLLGLNNMVTKAKNSPISIITTEGSFNNQLDTQEKGMNLQRPKFDSRLLATRSKEEKRSPVHSDLEFCRSLQRKTHKYSLEMEMEASNKDDPYGQLFQGSENGKYQASAKTSHNYENLKIFQNSEAQSNKSVQRSQKCCTPQQKYKQNKQQEKIAMLKAEHAIQVSQYSQTIQTLNKKILILTHQKGLEELYSIHEREIMLLQLKIKELRNDIGQLMDSKGGDYHYKAIIGRLNSQIKQAELKLTQQRAPEGKLLMIQKEAQKWRQQYEKADKARANLLMEVQDLTKRIQIRDHEMKELQEEDNKKYKVDEEFAFKDEEVMKETRKLIKGVLGGSSQSSQYLQRKVADILLDLSRSREIILECNDFLMRLLDHLQSKLNDRCPQVVLDCNRFIRNFLMNNLSIF